MMVGVIQTCVMAQPLVTLKEANEKTKKVFDEGRKSAMVQAFGTAKAKYREALQLTPGFQDAMMELAGIYFSQKNMDSSIFYLNRILTVNPKPSARVYFTLATIYYDRNDYNEAIPFYEKYLESDVKNPKSVEDAKIKLASSRFALDAMKNPLPFDPKPISGHVNTDYPEYLPSISADGSVLVFSRMIDGQEDLFYSRWDGHEWTKAVPLSAINTENYNEAGQCISADGHTIVYTGCNMPGGLGSCDLYISYLQNGKWSKPKNMGAPINTPGWESQPSLSADGRTLYFASDRFGGYGLKDIWYSEKSPEGIWSTPKNIGAPINTLKNDGSPFIHSDNKTLYFMSDGHPGMGGTDIFLSRRQDDDSWGDPVNLGYPINTAGNEGALIVNPAGDIAFYTSVKPDGKRTKEGFEDTDIYSFTLDSTLRPSPVSFFKAKILDSLSGKPIVANVQVTDIRTGLLYFDSKTADDGTVLICLPKGGLYGIQIVAGGYVFISEAVEIPNGGNADHPFIAEYLLRKIEESKGRPIVMKNIYFASGSAELSPVSDAELKVLAAMISANPGIRVRINGHTDDVGSIEDNLQLSLKRANAVINRLIEFGMSSKALSAKGFGESVPVGDNTTEVGRKANRRIEFEILP